MKSAAVGLDAELLCEVVEDPPVGLVHSDVARDHDSLEPCQEVEPLSGNREHLRRPVAERDQSDARSSQIGKYVDRSRDLPGQHLGPSPVERLDQFSPLRMLGDQEVDGLGPWSPRVLACVPFRRGHLGKERLHLVRVIERAAGTGSAGPNR